MYVYIFTYTHTYISSRPLSMSGVYLLLYRPLLEMSGGVQGLGFPWFGSTRSLQGEFLGFREHPKSAVINKSPMLFSNEDPT